MNAVTVATVVEVWKTPIYQIPGGISHAHVVEAPGIEEQFDDPDEALAFAQHLAALTGFAIRDLRSL
jgi:hypothetical protein